MYKTLETKAAAGLFGNFLFDLVTANCSCVTVKFSDTYANAAMQKSLSKHHKSLLLIIIRINAPFLNSTITKRSCILPKGSHF